MPKKILYIGNDLFKKTGYPGMMEELSYFLTSENFTIYKTSQKLNKLARLLDMCISILKFKNNLDYILIDTYSTTNFYYAFISSQLVRIFRIKYIPILHGGNLPHRLEKSPKMSKLIFENSYHNVAPSNYLKEVFENRGYKTRFIPNVLKIKDYPFKMRLQIEPRLLWVRSFKELYNPILAIEVVNLLKENFENVKLCMIGPSYDSSYQRVKNLTKKYNLENAIEFTGILSKKEWHKKSEDYSIFINTTNFDNTPVSVMEAMALGLTVVSTNVGGMPYLINDKKEGILVESKNVEQMAKAIEQLIENNNTNLALEARKKVENFDWEIVKREWIKILK